MVSIASQHQRQEKTSPVFVYATCNDVLGLPPELLRKGRFDEMFSVAMPGDTERFEILEIHLKKKNRWKLVEDGMLDIPTLVELTKGYSGAEIEGCIVEAMFSAFAEDRELNMLNLQDAISNTIPLSETMKERLSRLEEWCKNRTRPANDQSLEKLTLSGRRVDA